MVPYPPAATAPSVEFEGGVVDAVAMADRVARAAGALRDAGVTLGDRVGVWTTNDLDSVVSLLGVSRAGATLVPLDPRLTRPEAVRRVEAAGIRLLVAPGGAPDLGVATVADLDGAPLPAVVWGDDHPYAIVFTSGTAGPGKGVVLTRRNVAAAIRASAARLGNGPDDAWLAVLPLFHVGGLSILWRSAAARGRIVLQRRFEPSVAAAALAGGAVTVASLVPTMLRRILAERPGPFRGVRAVLLGGGPVSAALVTRALDAGLPVLTTYGMTETTSQAATVVPGQERESLGTAGIALDGVEIRIVTRDGVEGGLGWVEVRGAVVSPGYLGDPPRRPADWHRTGDLGRLDAAGRLVVVGRADDVIVTGGENVHPTGVEEVLMAIPDVAAAAVFGMADPEWGSVVAAALVAAPGAALDLAVVAAAARSSLAGFQVPRRWTIVDELPYNSAGKVDRVALAERLRRGGEGSA